MSTPVQLDAFEDPVLLRRETDRKEARDVVRIVNLGYDPGTRLFFQQKVFKMPEKGETFPCPRRFAKSLIRTHKNGALTFPQHAAATKAALAGNTEVPLGFAVVTEEDAILLQEMKAKQALAAQADRQPSVGEDVAEESDDILDELDL